ncbi:hypothetical protein N7478_001688 [Penicillium angulare]|uniref:uncharacterized protein n=1 Tax=Penicillium angulare TaxID=116970 RepID=UPI0025406C6A|nr:uncharacterized protein N7478_001688 [Penicillium angulare]KAJ5288658.1 hypothetical protein N7478_001688 [Penicillium angulare]
MIRSRHSQDFWFTTKNTEDGFAEIHPVDDPRYRPSRGRDLAVVIPSATPSPLSEVNEELLENYEPRPNSQPPSETAGLNDVTMTDFPDNSSLKAPTLGFGRPRPFLGSFSSNVLTGKFEADDPPRNNETRPSVGNPNIQGMLNYFRMTSCTKTSNPTVEIEDIMEEETRSSDSPKTAKDLLAAFQAKPSVNKFKPATEIDDDMKDPDTSVSQSASTQEKDYSPGASRVSYVMSEETGLFEIQETQGEPLSPSDLNHSSREITKSNLVTKQLRGPKCKLGDELQDILLEWHQQNPSDPPPCQWKGRWDGTKKWDNFRVFNRDKEEYEVSIYKIRLKHAKSGTYLVSVLQSEYGPDVLSGISTEHRPNLKSTGYQGDFITAWLGPKDGWEKEPSAIHVWAPEKTKVEYQAKWFDLEQGSKVALYKAQKYATKSPKSPVTPKTPSPAMVKSISSESDELSTPCKKKVKRRIDSDSDSEDVVGPTTRVCRRLFSPSSIRFKLTSSNSLTVRMFPFDEKTDVGALFNKTCQFYRDVCWTSERALLCQVPGEEELRYVGLEDEDEFALLCDDIKRLSIRAESPQVIEVKPAFPVGSRSCSLSGCPQGGHTLIDC